MTDNSEFYMSSNVSIIDISNEDLYNKLYWDHRIYDLRCKEDYIKSHLCRAHNINPFPTITIDSIAKIDAEIDDNYGRAEQPSDVIIYTNNNYKIELNCLLSYLISSMKFLKRIHILIDGYEQFHSIYPFLCTDSIYYNECSQLVWPSCIASNLYLGSSMCRNETVISMLNITHILSLSEYPEQIIRKKNIQTLHWKIADSLSANLLDVFPVAVRWISKGINDDKGIVLVHCDQGVSRSASVIIAYLLTYNVEFSTVDAALNHVKSKRGVIRPNASFLDQLEKYLINIQTEKEDLTTC